MSKDMDDILDGLDEELDESTPASEALHELWTPQQEGSTLPMVTDMGQMLRERGAITAEQMSTSMSLAERSPGKDLAQIYLEMGVDEQAIQQVIAVSNGLKFERVDPNSIEEKSLHRLGLEFCKNNGIMPLRMVGSRLLLGVVNPNSLLIIDEVRHKLGLGVKPVVVTRGDINEAIDAMRDDEEQTVEVDQIIAGIEEDDVEVMAAPTEEVDLEKMAGESPVIRFVNYLIFNAVKEGASDIHIEPQEKKLQVRYRIDGLLFESMNPPSHMQAAIVSRLKIMANLDISERRLPQDGRIRAMVHGRKLDLRVSTLPTAAGEKVVLRILDARSIQVPLDGLGISEENLVVWQRQIAQPHGILLVTGPTGSGKTTTLYASLGQMDRGKLNISTVEDPVEYHLAGINQTQVHEKIGMTFSAALRSLLRQDPDVVMVGEIRDSETARIAIQASLTGHLVLSTLHTNDAPSSITRLINIGVEPYLIAAAVNGVLAQRLVRKICQNCREKVKPGERVAELLEMQGLPNDKVWEGQGCPKCRNTGYAGRLGLYELLVLDDMLRDRIAGNPNVAELRRICMERGMVGLRQDGFDKAMNGLTSVDEVLRVTSSTI